MEENKKNTGHGMGVAALIMGIISIVVAFIPCIGFLAFFTAVVAIVLGAIGISQASRADAPKGMSVGGVVTGGVALLLAISQIVFFAGFSSKLDIFGDRLEEVFEDVEKEIMEDFEEGDFKITIEDGEDKIEIEGSARKEELRDKLEKLEGVEIKVKTEKKDTVNKEE